MLDKVNGRKSYLVAGSMAAYAIGGIVMGYLDPKDSAEILMAAGALVGLAHKLEKASVENILALIPKVDTTKPEDKPKAK